MGRSCSRLSTSRTDEADKTSDNCFSRGKNFGSSVSYTHLHPETGTLDSREMLDQRFQFFMIKKIGITSVSYTHLKRIKDFLLSDKSREFLIFLFFFLIAGGFWLIQTLNNCLLYTSLWSEFQYNLFWFGSLLGYRRTYNQEICHLWPMGRIWGNKYVQRI